MKAKLTCTCVDWPFGILMLGRTIERAEEITKEEFLEACDVDELEKTQFILYPNDYEFFHYQTWYFYTWSRIKHFYKIPNKKEDTHV